MNISHDIFGFNQKNPFTKEARFVFNGTNSPETSREQAEQEKTLDELRSMGDSVYLRNVIKGVC